MLRRLTRLLPSAALLLTGLAPLAVAAPPPGSAFYYRPVEKRETREIECEVAVYGGTSAGSIAAIQAARMGRKVTLLSFNRYVGGLTSGGLTATDLGNKNTIGGLAREFYRRVGGLADFSSVSAEKLYHDLLREAGVTVLHDQLLESVEMDGTRIVAATMTTGLTVKAAMFIDATYEGDLLAAAKVSRITSAASRAAPTAKAWPANGSRFRGRASISSAACRSAPTASPAIPRPACCRKSRRTRPARRAKATSASRLTTSG